LVLSLLIWAYFYFKGLTLTATETEVVVGLCLLFVLGVQWFWTRLRSTKAAKPRARKARRPTGAAIIVCVAACLQARAVTVACSPDTPMVPVNGSVVLRAWTISEPGQPPRYTWSAATGEIRGQGSQVRWSLQHVRAGIFTAEVKLEGATDPAATCSIRVIVFENERSPDTKRETGRSFLVKGNAETPGYGLYSYLLFGSHPADATRQRYLKALSAYLAVIYDISDFEEYVSDHSKLNITYLPVTSRPEGKPGASWLLDHYDFVRARVYLDRLPGGGKDGVYLVSAASPLGEGGGPPYLFQDLSTVPAAPEDLLTPWVREFQNQAAQERFWEPRTMEILTLKLRTTIAVLAIGLPEVQSAVHKWISSIR
jgi:hypothetical protein